ncbi:hypothetical protein DTX80_17570 [Bacilli bacterium]|uniref:hypothetical protein n=1 Tax=Oceanobacillus TaxID=182709 RepID=UPI0006222A26|nr:hypothetical protein WH51_14245 [Bacilli bacterium VT-13-104]PZD83280.1 hypothetical protein DEJ64_15545 [Bacilli bacterium]PZD84464.1 hypothetical protein DEJ60_14625 [Bacilli bacterium]PZD86668.1 hypothetical protein DEJ66_15105 [Bacilli bacterium]RCO04344.1 hypothetical protein DTX80_17570 [Bacilli bacterium]
MYIYLDDSGVINSSGGKFYVWAGFSIKSGYKRLATKLIQLLINFKETGDRGPISSPVSLLNRVLV